MKPTSLIDSASAWTEPILGSDRLSHEIFSILESRFLFGPDETLTLDCCGGGGRGRVRILSIDGGGGGELAVAALARLEARLRELSGNPSARIVDFFDLAAGSGAGAILAAALFAGGGEDAADAAAALALIQSDDHHRRRRRRRRWLFGRRSRGGGGSTRAFERVFGDATMRDAAKPLLIPCYDAATGAPYVFSRADAAEGDSYDFFLRDVCAAAYGSAAAVSVDGATRVLPAPAMATAMASPAAAAVTHVLHNKREFPFVAGFGDLLVVSVGNGGGGGGGDGSAPSASETAEDLLRIAGAAQADMVDQALAFAFGESRSAANYVRIQGDGATAGRTLAERSVESVLFRGRRMAQTTNGERLDWAAGELVKEEERRRRSKTPTVLIKPPAAAAAATPRTSSSASSEITTVTTVSGASSAYL